MKLTYKTNDGKTASKWFKPQAYFVEGGKGKEAEIDFGPASDAVSAYAIQNVETNGVLNNVEAVRSAFGNGSKSDLFRIKHNDIVTHEVTRGNLLTILADAETLNTMLSSKFEDLAKDYNGQSVNGFIKEANERRIGKDGKGGLVTIFPLKAEVKPKVTRNSTKKTSW